MKKQYFQQFAPSAKWSLVARHRADRGSLFTTLDKAFAPAVERWETEGGRLSAGQHQRIKALIEHQGIDLPE